MFVINHSLSWSLWRCIVAHMLHDFRMRVVFVTNLLPGAAIWRHITAYILGNIHIPAKCVINLSLVWVTWRLIITYILEEVHIYVMYVINLSLNIAIWRSINAYIMKYVRILVMWNKSFSQHYGLNLSGTSLLYSDESHWLLQSWSVHLVHNITPCINMNHNKGGTYKKLHILCYNQAPCGSGLAKIPDSWEHLKTSNFFLTVSVNMPFVTYLFSTCVSIMLLCHCCKLMFIDIQIKLLCLSFRA